jgi:hypothetical protein
VVQQRRTATVAPEPGPNERHQTSDQRIHLHPTLLPTVVVQDDALDACGDMRGSVVNAT